MATDTWQAYEELEEALGGRGVGSEYSESTWR